MIIYFLHLQIRTWIKKNFEYAPNSENENQHIVWIWRGHYLNCGDGGEIGLYERPHTISKINVEQWEQSDIRMPMTLYLYNKKYESNIFSWAPTEKQWWITGLTRQYMIWM